MNTAGCAEPIKPEVIDTSRASNISHGQSINGLAIVLVWQHRSLAIEDEMNLVTELRGSMIILIADCVKL